jgi:hypothetical protein
MSKSIFVPHKQKSSRIGRPKLPKGEAKSCMVRARMSPDELVAIETIAKTANKNLSEWVRETLISRIT